MDIIKLSHRLRAIGDYVPQGAKIADIGTDHGYIPVWLAQNRIADQICAADINRGPLDHAVDTAKQYQVFDRIRFVLSSGLQFEGSDAYDTVIIAGMGGELIASILEAAPWTQQGEGLLILQPNSRIPHLVQWLQSNGYQLFDARLVKDVGKLYQILVVKPGASPMIEKESDRLINPIYFEKQDPLLGEYLDTLLGRYRAAERGMLAGKQQDPELDKTRQMIADLTEMKEEVMKWQR